MPDPAAQFRITRILPVSPRANTGSSLRVAQFLMLLTILLLTFNQIAHAAPPAAPAPATQPSDGSVPVIDLFFKGGFFMYPLALCSVAAVSLIIERFLALRRSQIIPRNFMKGLKVQMRDLRTDRERGLQYCRKHDSPIARIIAAGIKRVPRGIPAAEKAIEDAGANEALKLRRNMRFLYALGSVSTLLGLIGTISGMIKAFQAASVAGIGKVNELSTGIYEAMVNTFGGLAVAIVVTIFYYFFVGRIERLISDLNDQLTDFSDDFGFNAESDTELRTTSTL